MKVNEREYRFKTPEFLKYVEDQDGKENEI